MGVLATVIELQVIARSMMLGADGVPLVIEGLLGDRHAVTAALVLDARRFERAVARLVEVVGVTLAFVVAVERLHIAAVDAAGVGEHIAQDLDVVVAALGVLVAAGHIAGADLKPLGDRGGKLVRRPRRWPLERKLGARGRHRALGYEGRKELAVGYCDLRSAGGRLFFPPSQAGPHAPSAQRAGQNVRRISGKRSAQYGQSCRWSRRTTCFTW